MSKFQPSLEVLESRDAPVVSLLDGTPSSYSSPPLQFGHTDRVYLDFSWGGYSVLEEFRLNRREYPRNRHPYDFNRDRRITAKDLSLMASHMAAEMDRMLPERMSVAVVDLFVDRGVGERVLRERDGYVMKVGGYTGDGTVGQAFLADPGENVAGSGFVFSGELLFACYSRRLNPWWRVRELATVAVHEWLHLIGVEHTNYRQSDIMSPEIKLGVLQNIQPEHMMEIERSWSEPFTFVDYGPAGG